MINLTSTAVIPNWNKQGSLICTPLTSEKFSEIIKNSDKIYNFCGHPSTTELLKKSGLSIPDQLLQYVDGKVKLHPKFKTPMGAFWDGIGIGIAARPRGGIRSAATNGDTELSSLDQLEFLRFEFVES